MNDHRITQLELQTRRRSSSRSTSSAGAARASITSTGNVSPVQTIASRSSTHSIIVVRAPPTLLGTPTSAGKRISRTTSRLSSNSFHEAASDRSEKSEKSECKTGRIRQALTSSFLRRKRVEYAGIDLC